MPEEIRSILNQKKNVGFYFKANWVFSTAIEKVSIAIIMGLAIWKIVDFFI